MIVAGHILQVHAVHTSSEGEMSALAGKAGYSHRRGNVNEARQISRSLPTVQIGGTTVRI